MPKKIVLKSSNPYKRLMKTHTYLFKHKLLLYVFMIAFDCKP